MWHLGRIPVVFVSAQHTSDGCLCVLEESTAEGPRNSLRRCHGQTFASRSLEDDPVRAEDTRCVRRFYPGGTSPISLVRTGKHPGFDFLMGCVARFQFLEEAWARYTQYLRSVIIGCERFTRRTLDQAGAYERGRVP